MMNDEFADVTFALFALKARESRRGSWCVTPKPYASSCCMHTGEKVNIPRRTGGAHLSRFLADRLATLGLSPEAIFAALNSQNG